MTFITLFSSEHGFIASDQRVFAPDELEPLSTALEHAQLLDKRLSEQAEKVGNALQDATEKGYEEGLSQGLAAAKTQATEELRQLHERHASVVEDVKNSCAELAVDIVRKIAGNVDSDQWLAAQALHAAEEIVDYPSIKLRVSASRVTRVRELLVLSAESSGTPSLIVGVVGDDTVSDQTCILDTGTGQIDVSLETQLSSVLELLHELPAPSAPHGVAHV